MKGATTFSIKGMHVDTQHNNTLPLCWVSLYFITMTNVIKLSVMLSVMALNEEEEEKLYNPLVPRHSQSPRFSPSSTSGNNLIYTYLFVTKAADIKPLQYTLFLIKAGVFLSEITFSNQLRSLIFPTQRFGTLRSSTFPAKYKTCRSFYQATRRFH